ncbi:hypothetical protein GCM10009555_075680 [Acrocarpospora macrocephala]|uniref:FtsX extracellular domain-containing protein n=1 Tax=Acrocarpospora macrocephala TaxID=150177 RepID=A0A5M3XD32_9ACTN|nr:permease-like cell division protein FtsX [Acrocarpospora macrocephala]GES16803.1 hypothetical protein Amac_104010 [Acrocarpospora macrocephala]
MIAYLCQADEVWEACGSKAVTSAQQDMVGRELRKIPGLVNIRYRSQKEALEDLSGTELAGVVSERDLPEVFSGELIRWRDAEAISAAAKALPGVSNVYVHPARFWEDKADVGIVLCGFAEGFYECEGRGVATGEEIAAIEAWVRRAKGVRLVYFVDRAYEMRLAQRLQEIWTPENVKPGRVEGYSESFYARLSDPRSAQSLVDAVKGLPGVADVFKVRD